MPRPSRPAAGAAAAAADNDDGGEGDAEFNPAFRFDLGGGGGAAAAAPAWQFSDALQAALRDRPATGTSLDDKIRGRLQERDAQRERRLEAKKRPRLPPPPPGAPPPPPPQRKKARRADDEDDDDDDDNDEDEEEEDLEDDDDDDGDLEEEEEDSEEAPLPGEELGDDDDDDDDDDDEDDEEEEEELEDEDDDDDEADVDMESEDEEEQQQQQKADRKAAPKQQQAAPGQPKKGAAAAAAARPPQQNNTHNGFYAPAPEGTAYAARSFADLNLSRPLLRAVDALGYASPTPIQAAVVPVALAGRDVCASAVTGSGKTAAFALPFLERLLHRPRHHGARGGGSGGGGGATHVLILAPARELAVQVHAMVSALARHTDVSVALAVGGLSLQAQAAELRRGPEVVVATPGRAVDHLRNTPCFGLEELSVLVLDEADRLLEMGFADEVREVVKAAPKSRQTLLFSATFNEDVRALADLSLRSPVRLAADPAASAPLRLRQEVVRLRGPQQAARREAALLCLCSRPWFVAASSSAGAAAEAGGEGGSGGGKKSKAAKRGKKSKGGGAEEEEGGAAAALDDDADAADAADASTAAGQNGGRTIVFFRTKARAHRARLLFGLARLPPAAELHGDMTQAQRLEALERFRRGDAAFLLATDVASRGLDIPGVRAVVNADCPRTLETYLHRVGRTARAGKGGAAVTLADDGDRALLKAVVKKAGAALQQRALPGAAVASWHAKIEKLEPDVRRVLEEERHEASLRRAELEAQRAANLLEHEEEIAARPARTWFQTSKERAASREKARAAALGGGGGKGGGSEALGSAFGGGGANDADPARAAAAAAANQARRREDAKAKKRAAAEDRAAGGPPGRGRGALAEATEAQVPRAKSVKNRARQLVQQGVPAAKATRIAAAAVTGVGTKKQKKSARAAKAGGGGGGGGGGDGGDGGGGGGGSPGGGLFSGDGAGGGGSAAAKSKRGSRAGLSRQEINKLRRGGKGAKAFKSKGRFKSRYKKRGKR